MKTFTIDQTKLDCSGLLVPQDDTNPLVISEIYVFGGTGTKTYLDFFTETPITNCADLGCNYGDSCGDLTTISGTNVYSTAPPIASPYTLDY